MKSPIAQQATPAKTDTTAARKRRRRAPAGGAADDCFTCIKRNLKCDRRRPYCSQCLEHSNECSGYKTQLTWGVGVASRGKLRGLSLPIAKSAPVTKEPKRSPIGRNRTASSNSHSSTSSSSSFGHRQTSSSTSNGSLHWPEESRRSIPIQRPLPIDIPSVSQMHAPTILTPTSSYGMPNYDYLSTSHPDSTPPLYQGSWGSPAYSPGLVSPDFHPRFSKFPLSLVSDPLSSSVSSVGSDLDYMSPISSSFPRDDLPFVPSPTMMYDSFGAHQSSPVPQSPPTGLLIDHSRAPTSCPGLIYAPSEPSSMPSSHHLDVFEAQLSHKTMREYDNLSVSDADAHAKNRAWLSSPTSHPQDDDGKSASSHDVLASPQWPADNQNSTPVEQGLSGRMRLLMDYYSHTLCPSMVFIDGPSNPFRDRILNLATNSQSLQHAICALSACNLRMRKKVSLGYDTHKLSSHLVAEKQAAEALNDAQIDDAALSEEYQHRNLAVQLLNQQLNDPLKASDDAVLATILLLCHYRMIESGIAKFQTQFSGVKRILALRRAQLYGTTTDMAWMESMFIHLDSLAASTNDRASQFVLPDTNSPLENAENFMGCDQELLNIINRLGRLNLLSQYRTVSGDATSPVDEVSRSEMAFGISFGNNSGYNMSTGPCFDGNGFGSIVDDKEYLGSISRSAGMYESQQASFWAEWKDIRSVLQNYKFDSISVAARLPGSPTASQLRDLGTLSEAFRYAALLYAERLASPTLPSGHSNFQNLVSQVVYYATSLESGSSAAKFSLWPLFIAGSECVNELQQTIIKTKCRDMMASSGYMTNLSALVILEKLWATDLKESEARTSGARMHAAVGRRSAFTWTKHMAGVGSDMEWIMF